MKAIAVTRRYQKTSPGGICVAGEIERIDFPTERIEWCCATMKKAWRERFIVGGSADSFLNRNRTVNITTCHPYAEGAVWEECAIQFCPFCGVAVTVVAEDLGRQ